MEDLISGRKAEQPANQYESEPRRSVYKEIRDWVRIFYPIVVLVAVAIYAIYKFATRVTGIDPLPFPVVPETATDYEKVATENRDIAVSSRTTVANIADSVASWIKSIKEGVSNTAELILKLVPEAEKALLAAAKAKMAAEAAAAAVEKIKSINAEDLSSKALDISVASTAANQAATAAAAADLMADDIALVVPAGAWPYGSAGSAEAKRVADAKANLIDLISRLKALTEVIARNSSAITGDIAGAKESIDYWRYNSQSCKSAYDLIRSSSVSAISTARDIAPMVTVGLISELEGLDNTVGVEVPKYVALVQGVMDAMREDLMAFRSEVVHRIHLVISLEAKSAPKVSEAEARKYADSLINPIKAYAVGVLSNKFGRWSNSIFDLMQTNLTAEFDLVTSELAEAHAQIMELVTAPL
jgi:hypothetical protein